MIQAIVKALLGNTLDTVVDRLTPDVNLRKEAKIELEKALVDTANAALLAQIEVNKKEADHPSIFVAGWRPMCGWICAGGLGWNFIAQPLLTYVMILAGYTEFPPQIELAHLMTILMGMLGLGGIRTFEGIHGNKRSTWNWGRRGG